MVCRVKDDGFGNQRFYASVVGNNQCMVYMRYPPAQDQVTNTYRVGNKFHFMTKILRYQASLVESKCFSGINLYLSVTEKTECVYIASE